ncbi:hypothetical protein HY734_01080 [Candidatus Uhrbacteria bacterium]|nr:hypothetical protein [Candidatus Uhrbacteria bacterium]
MSKTPQYNIKLKPILDALQPGEQTCAITGEKWIMTEEEIACYKRFNVPPSKYAPETRWKILGAFLIGNQIWYQKHPDTGKTLFTAVHPATGIKVLPDSEWYARDFSSVALDYDSQASFFDQLRRLQLQIPMTAEQRVKDAHNSIALVSLGVEDSYFVLACECKRCYFGVSCSGAEDSAEIVLCESVFKTYNALHSRRLHNCRFIRESADCVNSSFLFDCRNCESCFGATNKRNKKHLFFNEQLTKEEWERRVGAIDLGDRKTLESYVQKFRDLVGVAVWPENFNEASPDSMGEYLTDCTGMHACYFGHSNSSNQLWVAFALDQCAGNAFCFGTFSSSDCYYSVPGTSSQCKFSFEPRFSFDVEYSFGCSHCEHCFGCVGLRNKKFCIFNKQYSEEEYWKRVDELKCAMLDRGEYGEFFPASMSSSYYMDAGSTLFFGADEEFGRKIGANLFDPASEGAMGAIAEAQEVRRQADLPSHVGAYVPDEWVGKPILDGALGRRFAYLRPELAFYKTMQIAPPVTHFVSRIRELYEDMNIGSFTDASCRQCGKGLRIAKNRRYPDRTVYCKACYLAYLEQNG